MDPFRVVKPRGKRVPIIVSIPHCGTAFPQELIHQYNEKLAASPDDTDWFVDKLYDFAPSLGITMISAVFSRWVIDLNRDPESKPLYNDGRIITALCPTTDFFGNPIYRDQRTEVDSAEVQRRVDTYYLPYHQKVKQLIAELKEHHDEVLLWDCHSIRQLVPTIRAEKFPDLILGSNDEKSAGKKFINAALEELGKGPYELSHNHPFKGGFITRDNGSPEHGVHALQLEMCKVHYMDDAERVYSSERADQMRFLLTRTLSRLIENISE